MSEKERALNFFYEHKEAAQEEIVNYEEKYFDNSHFEYYLIRGTLPKFKIVFSAATGVYLWDSEKGIQQRFLRGKYYGVTGRGGNWFFARSNKKGYRNHLVNNRITDICLVNFDGDSAMSCHPVIYGVPGEVHQMDIWNDQLVIPHTDYNQLLFFDLEKLLAGEDLLDISQADYIEFEADQSSHVNSIYMDPANYYIVAHNFSWKTGQDSELIVIQREGGDAQRLPLNARSAHNYTPWNGNYLLCDSQRGTFRLGDQVLLQTDNFLRGLSISEEYLFVGGSDVQFGEYVRYSQNAYIYIMEHSGKPIAEIMVPAIGDIYEIRQFEGDDFAMSASS